MNTPKRQQESQGMHDIKKNKKENCPHAERCYRRNPHHFREYEHPHLNDFLKQGDEFTLPDAFPQDKRIVQEQLDVLKSLSVRPQSAAPENRIKTATSNSVQIVKNSEKTKAPSSDSVKTLANTENMKATSSSGRTTEAKTTNKKPYKTTNFVPNSKTVLTTKSSGMKQKLEKAHPYYLFFTKVPEAIKTLEQENAISFTDLLCPSLGELKCSLQMNFMIDIMWLMEQYQAQSVSKKPLTIVYGYEFPSMKEYIEKFLPNVTHHLFKMKDPFGTHHSKIGLYTYTDGSLRVVVSTANLYYEDWNNYNQGLWVSPTIPKLPDSSSDTDGSGPTGFKTILLKYLQSYNLPCLKEWIEYVKRADFSTIKVFLVVSIPGKHYPKDTGSHLHRVADLLGRHCVLPAKTTPQSEGPLSWGINAQASSIGSLGKTPAEWLRSVLLRTLSSHKQGQLTSNSNATINVIFPTTDNVLKSYFGPDGGGCLPYSKSVNEKQKWLKDYLHQWKADHTHRSRAMPHIKTYCRVSPCLTKLAWFLITSANISKAAWGGNIQKDFGIYVRSYEVGVLFLPSFFDEQYFTIKDNGSSDLDKLFPFIYDLPLTPYKSNDGPWCN